LGRVESFAFVNARTLLLLFDAIYLLALSAWVGSVLFLTLGVAPLIFKVLGTEPAARFVRALFPRYYAWCATCGAIALAAFVSGPLSVPELRGSRVAIQAGLLLAGTLIMLYGGNSLSPAISAARDAGAAAQERFERLHRRSVRLNVLVLVIGVLLLVGFATRPTPATPGIVEPSPAERARREDEQFQRILDQAHTPVSRPRGQAPAAGGPAGRAR
jgi:hypothetical protein